MYGPNTDTLLGESMRKTKLHSRSGETRFTLPARCTWLMRFCGFTAALSTLRFFSARRSFLR